MTFNGEIVKLGPKPASHLHKVGYVMDNWNIQQFEEYTEPDVSVNGLLLGGYFNLEGNERVSITFKHGLTIFLEEKKMLVWNKVRNNAKEKIVIGKLGSRFLIKPESRSGGYSAKNPSLITYENAEALPKTPHLTMEQVKAIVGYDFVLVKD